jgi:hypothetical protein
VEVKAGEEEEECAEEAAGGDDLIEEVAGLGHGLSMEESVKLTHNDSIIDPDTENDNANAEDDALEETVVVLEDECDENINHVQKQLFREENETTFNGRASDDLTHLKVNKLI